MGGGGVGLQQICLHIKQLTSSSSKSYAVEGGLGWVGVRGGSTADFPAP